MSIEATVRLRSKLKPLRAPNFVLIDGEDTTYNPLSWPTEQPKYALSQLDEETLDALCVQFRADIFKKAGKEDPAMRSK